MEDHPIRALLIDDDEDDYLLVRDLLSNISPSKYRLEWADDFENAWDLIGHGGCDVCLLDYRLGGRNGLELLEEMKKRGIRIPVVLLTGHGDYALDLEAMKAGAADYLSKNELTAALLERSIRYATERCKRREELRETNIRLEERVDERTAKLVQVNAELKKEVEERKVTESALRESRRRLSVIVGSIADGFYALDRDWRFTHINDAALRYFFKTREEMIGRTIFEVFPFFRGSVFEKEYRQAMESGEPVHLEAPSVVWDRTVEIHAYPGPDNLTVLFWDVTEQYRVAESLRESEARFRSIYEQAAVGIVQVGLDGRLLMVNEAICRMLGYAPEELERRTTSEITWPDDLEMDGEHLERLLAREIPSISLEKRYRHKDGHPVWVRVTSSFVDQGTDSYRVAIIEDITEHKGGQDALHRFELLAAHSRDIILFMRRGDGRILEANAASVSGYGYGREELLAMTVHDLRAPQTQAQTREQMEEADVRGILFETVHRRKDGTTFPVEVSSRGAAIRGERTLISVIRDISERKRTEEALRDSLEEKVALLNEVHHRVKNNLQIVASLLSLQANRSNNPQVVDVLQDTRNRVRSMALLHETLYRSGNLAHINFASYVGTLCRQLLISFGPAAARVKVENRVARAGMALELAVPCGLIINELVSNALKHGFPDERTGGITVELGLSGERMLVLSVRDDGVGLPAGLDPADTATLGLKLVSKLAGQLGGKLTMHRPEGSGVEFRVVFPLPAKDTLPEGES